MIFETTKKYVLFTLFFWFIALLTHIIAHTNFFSHEFFEEPNLYNVSETGWFVSPITHSLSSLAITATVLNFNLPLSFNKKWIIAFIVGVCSGLIWEVGEVLVAPVMNWVVISPLDTILDIIQNFYGSALAILLYSKIVKVPTFTYKYDFTINRKHDNGEIEELL